MAKSTKVHSKEKIDSSTSKKVLLKITPELRKVESTKVRSLSSKVNSIQQIDKPTLDSEKFTDKTFRKQLIGKFQKNIIEISLNNHYEGQVVKNEYGECFHISESVKIDIVKPNHKKIKQKLIQDLKVLKGIAKEKEKDLKRNGFKSVNHLINDSNFREEAINYINHVEFKNGKKIYDQLSFKPHIYTATHPIFLANSALFDLSDIVLIDIETLGLGEVPLFLIGIAMFKDSHLVIEQIFVRELNEEKAALHFFGELLSDKQAIVTFNGKSFDVPFILKRMSRHDLNHEIKHPHFDLYFFSQKAFSKLVYDFKLSTLERTLFNIERIDDVSGAAVPGRYKEYIKTKNIDFVIPIIDHNKQDLISTSRIFMKLYETLT